MAEREYIVTVPVRGFEYRAVTAHSKAEAMRKVEAGEDCELVDWCTTSWAKPSSARAATTGDAGDGEVR